MLPTRFLCASLLLLPTAAFANDGYGGLSATGLTFGQTEAVAMQEEDLYIGPKKIKVAYVFQNLTDKDVTGEVIFPLPPIMLAAMMEFLAAMLMSTGLMRVILTTLRFWIIAG